MPIGGGRGGGRGGGNASVGVLLRQRGEHDKGLFLTARGANLTWHGRGESTAEADPAIGGHIDLPNNGGGPGVNRHGALRLQFPADISDYEGAASNNIRVSLIRDDTVSSNPTVAWVAGRFTITVGATTEIAQLVTAIEGFTTFTVTTSLTQAAIGTDLLDLPANSGRRIANLQGGHDVIPPGVELLSQPEDAVNGPNVLVKYLVDHHSLQQILDELEENDQGVTITVPYGTDLTAAPEAVPWIRGFDAGVGPTEAPSTGTGGLTQAQVDGRVRALSKGYALRGGPSVPDSEIPAEVARDAEVATDFAEQIAAGPALDAANLNDKLPFRSAADVWGEASTTNLRALFKPTLPEWATINGLYIFTPGDIVPHNGGIYYALTEHQKAISGPETDPTAWLPLRWFWGDWTARYFPRGSITTHNGGLYFARVAVLNTDPAPDNASNVKWTRMDRAGAIHDGGEYGPTSTWGPRELVRHKRPAAAMYLTKTDVPVGIEPGVAANWTTYYDRLGWVNGAPDSVVSVKVDSENHALIVTKRDGTANSETLPAGGTPVIVNPDGTAGAEINRISVGGVPYNFPVPGYAFYARPALAMIDIAAATPATNTNRFSQKALDAVAIPGRIYAEWDFITDWKGGISLDVGRNGFVDFEMKVTHVVNSKVIVTRRVIPWPVRASDATFVPLDVFNSFSRIALGAYVDHDGNNVNIVAADLDGPTTITIEFSIWYPNGAGRGGGLEQIDSLQWTNVGVRFYQLPHGAGPVREGSGNAPSISTFGAVSGDLDPKAGNLFSRPYDVRWAIANVDHLGSARIIGFKGAFDASSVTVLHTLEAGTYAHGRATVATPADLVLGDSETYTLRLQAFARGDENPANATVPASAQDIVIAAHNPATAAYHVGFVEYDADDADAAATLARIADFDGDTDTAATLPERLVIDAPNDGKAYQLYLLAADDAAQPSGFTSLGLPATASFYPKQDKTIGGNDFGAWILRPGQRVTSADNGDYFGVVA